jgi:hypothetical protein
LPNAYLAKLGTAAYGRAVFRFRLAFTTVSGSLRRRVNPSAVKNKGSKASHRKRDRTWDPLASLVSYQLFRHEQKILTTDRDPLALDRTWLARKCTLMAWSALGVRD